MNFNVRETGGVALTKALWASACVAFRDSVSACNTRAHSLSLTGNCAISQLFAVQIVPVLGGL